MAKGKSPLFREIRNAFKTIDIRTLPNGVIELAKFRFPSNPNTEAQKQIRASYGRLVGQWRALSPEEKASYERRARRLKISGWNLFVKENFVLEQPPPETPIVQVREHKYWSGYNPNFIFSKYGNSVLEISSDSHSVGFAWVFQVFEPQYINGKRIRIKWEGIGNYTVADKIRAQIWDGEYNRKDDSQFPLGSEPPLQGNGILQTIASNPTTFSLREEEAIIDITPSLPKVTLMLRFLDAWYYYYFKWRIDYIIIEDPDSGEPVFSVDFTKDVIMEKTGTYGDYGYVEPE